MVNPNNIFRGSLDIIITDESGIRYKCSGYLINFKTRIEGHEITSFANFERRYMPGNISHYAEFKLSKVEYDDETSIEVTLVPPTERLLRKIDN